MRRPRERALVLLMALAASDTYVAAQTSVYHFRPERARRALGATVSAGDLVRLEAGGCFRRPDGTSEPLLQPDRSAPQALVFIPGVTLSFLPIADLAGRELAVAAPLETPERAAIWIDWGSFPRSRYESAVAGSPALPCATPNREPYLDVTIRRGASALRDRGEPGSLTLELNRYDRNWMPLDPGWIGRVRADPCVACEGFRLESRPGGGKAVAKLRDPKCTLQRLSVDASESMLCPGRRCEGGARGPTVGGHVNWGPATFTGRVSTYHGESVTVSRDGDIGLVLEPDGDSGVVAAERGAGHEGTIGLEFESSRTVRWFRSPFWRGLPFRENSFDLVASLFDTPRRHRSTVGPVPTLRRAPASAIGIFGIDNIADVHSELHPLYAIAIQLEASPTRERWAAFARRGGMEGQCGSRLEHTIDVSRLVLPLPGAGGTWDRVRGEFYDHGLPVADWKVYAGAAAPTLVIPLAAQACSVVEGEITLERGGSGREGPLLAGEPPPAEPALWRTETRPERWCAREDWFREVD